mgnify:CR=1 FL=1
MRKVHFTYGKSTFNINIRVYSYNSEQHRILTTYGIENINIHVLKYGYYTFVSHSDLVLLHIYHYGDGRFNLLPSNGMPGGVK